MEKTRGMMAGKKRWIFCVIFCFSVLFSNFSSANFVCGEVTSDSDVLPTWMNLLVYYDSAPEDTINCMVTGEHKYCCDLEQIESVNWSSGLLVLAEVYDDSGFVTERVSTQTSDAAYDLFPTLSSATAIDFVDEVDTIIIDTEDITQQEFNVVLHPAYNNLRVIIDHAGKEEVMEICTDCSEAHFTLDLLKGKNSVSFVAYGSRDMSVTQDFYVLDYLTIDRSFSCDNCNTQEEGIYVGGGEEVTVTLRVDSSHPLDGSLTEYIPSSWDCLLYTSDAADDQ